MPDESGGKGRARVAPEERRQYLRIRKEVQLSCRIVSTPEDRADISTRNLSTGGLLISTRKKLPVGACVQFRAAVEDQTIAFSVTGRVVWTDVNPISGRHEAGVCLIGLDASQRHNILSLIGKGSGQEGTERRHYIRLLRHLLVEYRVAHKLMQRWRPAHTQDISLGGMCLVTEERLWPSNAVTTRIHLDDLLGRPLEIEGVVLQCAAANDALNRLLTSVRFQKMADEPHQRLAAYISRMLSTRAFDIGGDQQKTES